MAEANMGAMDWRLDAEVAAERASDAVGLNSRAAASRSIAVATAGSGGGRVRWPRMFALCPRDDDWLSADARPRKDAVEAGEHHVTKNFTAFSAHTSMPMIALPQPAAGPRARLVQAFHSFVNAEDLEHIGAFVLARCAGRRHGRCWQPCEVDHFAVKRLVDKVDTKLDQYRSWRPLAGRRVLIVGAGPGGLRSPSAGAELTHIVEKRRTFARHNVLVLWHSWSKTSTPSASKSSSRRSAPPETSWHSPHAAPAAEARPTRRAKLHLGLSLVEVAPPRPGLLARRIQR